MRNCFMYLVFYVLGSYHAELLLSSIIRANSLTEIVKVYIKKYNSSKSWPNYFI